MAVNTEHVKGLIDSAIDGMTIYARENQTTAEDVINAMLNMTNQAIALVSKEKIDPQVRKRNMKMIQDTLQQFLLKTVDSGAVLQ